MHDPRAEYQRRQAQRQSLHDALEKKNTLLANARGMVFLVGIGLVVYFFRSSAISPAWLVAPLAVFGTLVIVHLRSLARQEQAVRAVAFYRRGLHRMDDRWQGRGNQGRRYQQSGHLYADDLDLFGEGSLFELLALSRTRMGDDALAAWLREPAGYEEILARQEAVRELCDRLDLREWLGTLPHQIRESLSPRVLTGWIERKPEMAGPWPLGVSLLLATALFVSAGLAIAGFLPGSVAAGVFVVEMIVLRVFHRRITAVARIAEGMSEQLDLFSCVLRILEDQTFQSPKLQSLHAMLETTGRRPSAEIKRLGRLIEHYDTAMRNMFALPFAVAAMWPVHLARAMERWRAGPGGRCRDWLAAVGQCEALLSLAGYAYEHPETVFPTIERSGPVFDGRQLGHPLLAEKICKRNDVRLDAQCRLLLVSGSNMSGKSTLLRTVGIHAVMALAGAPVRAESLRISPLAMGASINIRDSLQQGQSHFFAEMARLRDIVALVDGDRPVLFLFDEIMHGTNSRDRRIGAEAVLRRLVDTKAIGLVTTHDLALTEIVPKLNGQADNAHFADQLVDGRMVFDYQLRPGVVQTSNALEVMRSLGLDV